MVEEVLQTGVALHEGNEMDLTLPAAFKSGDKLLLATGQTFEKGMALCSPSSYTWLVDGEFDELRLSVGAAKSSLGGSVFEVVDFYPIVTSEVNLSGITQNLSTSKGYSFIIFCGKPIFCS